MRDFKKLSPGEDDLDRRLDRILRKAFPSMSLGEIYKAIRKGRVTVNGRKPQADYRLKEGDRIEYHPALDAFYGSGKLPQGENLYTAPRDPASQLDILMETSGLLIVNKRRGVLSHGPGSLETQVRQYLEKKIEPSLSFRPGPLHRLDRNTSGIIVYGKSLRAAREFSLLLREGKIKKEYLAVLTGEVEEEQLWEDILGRENKISRVTGDAEGSQHDGGKSARTGCRPLLVSQGHTLALMELYTGRTHQIRVQAAARGYPLLADRKYSAASAGLRAGTAPGSRKPGGGFYLLHAWKLMIPASGLFPDDTLVTAPPPEAFIRALKALFPPAEISQIIRPGDPAAGPF